MASMADESSARVSSSKRRRLRRRQIQVVKRLEEMRPGTPSLQYVQVGGDMNGGGLPPLLNSPELQLRFLNPGDLPEVKRLCREWFPIEYPDAWYTDITSTQKFYSVAAVYRGQIVGLVVAEIKQVTSLAKEDSELLSPTFGKGAKIGYILSLGVVKEFRKQGIASFLLENLIAHLTSSDNYQDVKGKYSQKTSLITRNPRDFTKFFKSVTKSLD